MPTDILRGLMQIGQAQVDFDTHRIHGPAGDYSIEPKVMEVFSVLVENAGEVVSRESLIDQVWGVGYGGDERLSRAISLLRKALGDTRGKHDYIQTIPKTGYKFIGDVKDAVPGGEGDVDVSVPTETAAALPEKKSRSALLALIPVAIIALLAFFYFGRQALAPPPEPPLVMIMDSAHPARIYDEQVKSEGATNADILSDILADLPVKTQKELISPSWHRYEAVLQFEPDLILIHYSGFKQEDASGDRPQLRLLVEYFLKTDTEFLVYSRASREWLQGNMDIILKDIYADNPNMKGRVKIFPLLEYGDPHWMDQAPAQGIKLKVKEMLNLE